MIDDDLEPSRTTENEEEEGEGIPNGKPQKLRDAISRIKERRTTVLIVAILIAGVFVGGLAIKDIYQAQKEAKAIQSNPKLAKVLNLSKAVAKNEVVPSESLVEDWKSLMERKVDTLIRQQNEAQKEGILSDKQLKGGSNYPSAQMLPPPPPQPTAPVKAAPAPPVVQNLPLPPATQTPVSPVSSPNANPGVPIRTTPSYSSGHFRTIDFSSTPKKEEAAIKTKAALAAKNIDLPIGIAVGLTINGMDAPTFQQGQQDPQPLLVSIETPLVTANAKEIDVKGCMVLASAHGSISAEKAMPRLVRMNCRDAEGNLYSGSVKGWILGDDGKVGITGRLVSRQGTVLAKSFWADVISLGGTFLRKSAETTTSYSALGMLQSNSTQTSDIAKSSAGEAVERSTDRIAKFFIKIAEQIYPVIEIMPGRKVTMMIESGSLKRVDKDNFAALTGLGSSAATASANTETATNSTTKKEVFVKK